MFGFTSGELSIALLIAILLMIGLWGPVPLRGNRSREGEGRAACAPRRRRHPSGHAAESRTGSSGSANRSL